MNLLTLANSWETSTRHARETTNPMGLANRVFNFPKKTEQSVKRKYWWEEVIFPRKFLGVFFHSFMETSNVKRAKVFYNPLLNTVGMHNGL